MTAELAPPADTARPAAAARVPDEQGAVDPQHPWLGLASFTEETRAYFHGREEEVAELARRVQRKLLTVLFGQSGLGKTSILRAGIVPRLRPEGYCPVYVRIDYSPESPPPSDQIKQAIFRATGTSGTWTQPGSAVAGESLWEFLHHRDDVLRDAAGKPLIPLLIFDQFEEIFTLAQVDDAGRRRAATFIEDLADLVENRPPRELEARLESDDTLIERFDFSRADYRILIALREDYLAHLEGVKGAMPSITQNRMRLARMNGQQALAAVMKPGGKLVSEEVAESIVRFISGGSELRNAEVEPSLLSLICRELNNTRIAQGRAEISADLLAGSHDTILHEFYERALADQPAAVRKVIEDQLLTDSGFRESLAEERVVKAFAAAGAPPDALATLVNRRLLRIEERLDVRRVELTHDVLCGVVKASRALRLEREARDEAERLLEGQRAREAATRKALVRARQVATVCAVLALGAIASAVFGFINMRRAQEAQATALQARQAAESARGQAEKLIVYLLDDFYQELEPVGRLDIVADLSKRALDYYAALPAELRSAETERNRALALVRYGYVLRYQAKNDEAIKALTEATGVLERLRAAGDRSEFAAIGLALGYTALARAHDSKGQGPESEKFAALSADVLRPLMAAPQPSVRLRLAYAQVMNYVGFNQLRQAHEEESVRSLEAAREAYRAIDGLSFGNLAAAAGYAESTAWEMDALTGMGRNDEARKMGFEGLEVARQVLDRRPGHMPALRAHALIAGGIARSEAEALRLRKAVQMTEPAVRDWETYLKLDPGNSVAWNNLAANHTGLGFAYDSLGRSDEALAHFRRVGEILRKFPGLAVGLLNPAGRMAVLDAEFGRPHDGAPEYRKLVEEATRTLPPGSFMAMGLVEIADDYDRQVALVEGRNEAARDLALAAYKRMAAFKISSAGQDRLLQRGLAGAAYEAAFALGVLKDYPAAETQARLAIEHSQKTLPRAVDELVALAQTRVLLAIALAREGRNPEAAALLETDLKYLRGLVSRGTEDLNHHFTLAQALYADAIAQPAQARALLAEAAALIDKMPKDMSRRKSVAQLRGWIAEEQGRR